jgi:hypothetical protein
MLEGALSSPSCRIRCSFGIVRQIPQIEELVCVTRCGLQALHECHLDELHWIHRGSADTMCRVSTRNCQHCIQQGR